MKRFLIAATVCLATTAQADRAHNDEVAAGLVEYANGVNTLEQEVFFSNMGYIAMSFVLCQQENLNFYSPLVGVVFESDLVNMLSEAQRAMILVGSQNAANNSEKHSERLGFCLEAVSLGLLSLEAS